MENKYFTPDIEDVTLGYAFEFCSLINPHTPEWVSMTLLKNNPYRFENSKGSLEIMQSNIEKGYIRVPYLTKEQIEAEGWFPHGQGNDNGIVYSLFKNSFRVAIWKDSLKIEVQESEGNILFYGQCKDINTFRKLCKLLHI